jgi:SAM-dependent methyltransferase
MSGDEDGVDALDQQSITHHSSLITSLYGSAAAYDLQFGPPTPDELDFWLGLAERLRVGRVLELGCGTGRFTLPLTRAGLARGQRVVGLDLAPSMLAGARAKLDAEPPAVRAALRLLAGDMRDFALSERFDLIFSAFNSFAHLHAIDDQLACLTTARHHLAPGGQLAISVWQPSLDDLARGAGIPDTGRFDLAADDPATGARLIRYSTARYCRDTQTQTVTFTYEWLFPSGEMQTSAADLVVHIFTPRELELLYRLAGLRVEAIYGDYAGGSVTATSSHLIMIGAVA